MRKRLSDVELSKSDNMTQYDPLLPQTSDAFFSSTISIPPYLLPRLLVTLVYDSSSSSTATPAGTTTTPAPSTTTPRHPHFHIEDIEDIEDRKKRKKKLVSTSYKKLC